MAIPLRTGTGTINAEQITALSDLLGDGLRTSLFPEEAVGAVLKERPNVVQQVLLDAVRRMLSMQDAQFAAGLGELAEAEVAGAY